VVRPSSGLGLKAVLDRPSNKGTTKKKSSEFHFSLWDFAQLDAPTGWGGRCIVYVGPSIPILNNSFNLIRPRSSFSVCGNKMNLNFFFRATSITRGPELQYYVGFGTWRPFVVLPASVWNLTHRSDLIKKKIVVSGAFFPICLTGVGSFVFFSLIYRDPVGIF